MAAMPERRVFTHRLRVTYTHCTIGNHVYYARYLDMLETARGEFFRAIGFPCLALQERDTVFQVTECSLKYLKPARYDDELEIRIQVSDLRKVRFRFVSEILRGSDRLVESATVMVSVSTHEKPKRIPEELLPLLQLYSVEVSDQNLAAAAPASSAERT